MKRSPRVKRTLYKFGAKSKLRAKIIATILERTLPLRKDGSPRKLEEIINQYADREKIRNAKYLKHLKRDILYSRIYYKARYSEYFLYRFEELTDKERHDFIGFYEYLEITQQLWGSKETHEIFKNKYQSYQTFMPYYHREMVEIRGEEDRERFLKFCERHPVFISKPEWGAFGRLLEKHNVTDSKELANRLFDKWIEKTQVSEEKAKAYGMRGGYIAEELVAQADEMAEMHPYSVNTIRVTTCLVNGKTEFVYAALRMGVHGSLVDNAGAGGIFALIDIETGIVKTNGRREKDLDIYPNHPDTGSQIIGKQIPRWDELLSMATELSRVVPEQRYVGWDMALTNDGWLLIESNDSAVFDIPQICQMEGLRSTVERMFNAEKNQL